MVADPSRAAPWFVAIVKVTLPFAFPAVPSVIEIQLLPLRAIQAQPDGVVTFTALVPPAVPMFSEDDESSKRHAAASCRICVRSPLTRRSPSRIDAFGFAETWKST
jgi:hypothetical protein